MSTAATATESHGSAPQDPNAAEFPGDDRRASLDGDPALANAPTPPPEAQSLVESGLSEAEIASLTLKVLLQHGNCSGTQISEIVRLPRIVLAHSLARLREELLVGIKGSAGVNDYVYQLSDTGQQRAQRHAERCRFIGPAPVPLHVYNEMVRRQSLQNSKLNVDQLCQAFSDLLLQPQMISQIGQALNDGRGLFLYGHPGNGKTSIAERVCNAFGQSIWIPHMLSCGGELIRLYDPSCHKAVAAPSLSQLKYDRRWVLIERPTIVVGGELTLNQLETRHIETIGISEAPIHLKSNSGTLVIDDFGRQRASSSDILNRLIVPLEKHYDFLNLPSGRQIRVPFDQLLVFSTNLAPKDLVDEAFFRRIPYKIEVFNPTQAEFCRLLELHARQLGFEIESGAVEYLIENHYKRENRQFRFCHPRDLLRQVKNFCDVHERPHRITQECFDVAVRNYFAGF